MDRDVCPFCDDEAYMVLNHSRERLINFCICERGQALHREFIGWGFFIVSVKPSFVSHRDWIENNLERFQHLRPCNNWDGDKEFQFTFFAPVENISILSLNYDNVSVEEITA